MTSACTDGLEAESLSPARDGAHEVRVTSACADGRKAESLSPAPTGAKRRHRTLYIIKKH